MSDFSLKLPPWPVTVLALSFADCLLSCVLKRDIRNCIEYETVGENTSVSSTSFILIS